MTKSKWTRYKEEAEASKKELHEIERWHHANSDPNDPVSPYGRISDKMSDQRRLIELIDRLRDLMDENLGLARRSDDFEAQNKDLVDALRRAQAYICNHSDSCMPFDDEEMGRSHGVECLTIRDTLNKHREALNRQDGAEGDGDGN